MNRSKKILGLEFYVPTTELRPFGCYSKLRPPAAHAHQRRGSGAPLTARDICRERNKINCLAQGG